MQESLQFLDLSQCFMNKGHSLGCWTFTALLLTSAQGIHNHPGSSPARRILDTSVQNASSPVLLPLGEAGRD